MPNEADPAQRSRRITPSLAAPAAPDPGAGGLPPLRAVTRTAILDRLEAGPTVPLVVVTGSAGYGKSTLILQYGDRFGRFAYLRLTPNHDDPSVLMQDLADVISQFKELRGKGLRVADRSLEPGLLAASRLAEALSALRRPASLLLDDVHLLRNRSAADALTVLIESLPTKLRIVAAGHDASALRLARLRAADRLLEVGEEELAFGADEVAELAALLQVDISEEETATIMAETRGWPLAVSLAMHSLANRDAAAGSRPGALVVSSVSDYIRTELVEPLDDERRSWLLRSAVLETMNGPLCDTALETTGSEALLREFHRSSLLVSEVTGEPGHFRYHPLLRTLLCKELEAAMPGEAATIAARATQWYHERGESLTALRYARASGDRDLTARFVSMHVFPLHWVGRINTLEQWVGWFDLDGVREHYPAVAVLAGFVFALDGQRHEAERWLSVAEHSDDPGPLWDGSSPDAWVAMLRGMMVTAGPMGLEADARMAEAGMRYDSPFMPGVRLLGTVASLVAGRREEAMERAHESAELSKSRGAWPGFAMSTGIEASLALRAGQQRRAHALIEHALDRLREVGMIDYVLVCHVHALAARLALASHSKEQARRHLTHVQRLRPLMTAAVPWYALQVRTDSVEALIALGDAAAARTLVREIDSIMQIRPDMGALGVEAAAMRTRLAAIEEAGAAQGTLTAAELRVLQYLPTHLTFGEIAERLYVSPHTVKSQAVAIYGKLGVSSRRAAIETAVTYGLLDDSALRFPLGPGADTGIG